VSDAPTHQVRVKMAQWYYRRRGEAACEKHVYERLGYPPSPLVSASIHRISPFLLTRQYAWHMVPHKSSVEISESGLIVGPGSRSNFLALK
jgi:hypothetical protein